MEEERLRKYGRREQSLSGSVRAVNADVSDGRSGRHGSGKELLLTWESSHSGWKFSALPCSHLHSSSSQTLLLSCDL